MAKVKTVWFQDLPKDEQESFKALVLGSKKVLDKLSKIVYNRCNDGEVIKDQDYDSPSWSHKQAHLNGKRQAYREIIELLKIEEY